MRSVLLLIDSLVSFHAQKRSPDAVEQTAREPHSRSTYRGLTRGSICVFATLRSQEDFRSRRKLRKLRIPVLQDTSEGSRRGLSYQRCRRNYRCRDISE